MTKEHEWERRTNALGATVNIQTRMDAAEKVHREELAFQGADPACDSNGCKHIQATPIPEGRGATPPAHIVKFAVEASKCSPCRSKRGVAIFRGDDLMNTGQNYKPRPFGCDGSLACKATCRTEAIHAEQHALLIAGSHYAQDSDLLHVKTVDGVLAPSGSPSCVQCSKLILASGIAGVWLYHVDGWRRYEAAEFHELSMESTDPPSDALSPHKEQDEDTRVVGQS